MKQHRIFIEADQCHIAAPSFASKAAASEHMPFPCTLKSDVSITGSPLGSHLSVSLDPQMLRTCLLDSIKTMLPGCLQAALSDLFIGSASSSLLSSGTRRSSPAVIPPAKLFQDMVLRPVIEVSLQQLFTKYLPKLQELVTDDLVPVVCGIQEQLQDIGEDYVSEMTLKKDDNVHDMEKSACDLLIEFKESLAAAVEELEEHCGDKLIEAFDQRLRQSRLFRDEDKRSGVIQNDLKTLNTTLDLLETKRRKHRNKATKLKEQLKREKNKAKSLKRTIKLLERFKKGSII